jgi:hypothetical protein
MQKTSDPFELKSRGKFKSSVRLMLLAFACLCAAAPSAATEEIAERKQIAGAAQQAFVSGSFGRLEAMSEAFRTEKSRTASGLWKLTLFYAGLDAALADASVDVKGSFEALEGKTAEWAKYYPDSPTAHIAQSMVLINHAWSFRGGGYASTVKPEAWAPFRQHIAKARENLETNKVVAARDPRWYETMLTIARAESWDRKQFDGLLNEALDREPGFYQSYFLALEYLLPKWQGDIVQIERFAQDAVKRTAKEEGKGMYARIYWYASQTQFKNDLFANSLAVWTRMRAGFEDVIQKYPDAWNLNNYAKFSCLAKDKKKTRELLARIEPIIVPEAWQPATLLNQCADWARQLDQGET